MNQLESLFLEIKQSKKSKKTTPKAITNKFGVKKRGWKVIEAINSLLEKYELTAEPEFGNAYFYGEIEIIPKPKLGANSDIKKHKYSNPIPRLSLLRAANIQKLADEGEDPIGLITVKKENSLIEASTLMLRHDFSQLPVLAGKRDVTGLISWKSIGIALSLGKPCSTVADCLTEVDVLSIDEPIFKAVSIILEKEVVLVKDNTKMISGIVTASDIASLFHELAEPFLIIEQIENLVRRLLDDKLTFDDIKNVLDINSYDKEIKTLSDLTFGHYVRIIENKQLFDKLGINVDRAILQKTLDDVRKVRNDVMHFNPEELQDEDLCILRDALHFLSTIANMIGI
jgi:CBS domain.